MRFFCFLFIPLLAILTFGAVNASASDEAPFLLPSPQNLAHIKTAVITTNKGTIIIELFPEVAPWHVANLKFLADRDFYDNIQFHLFRPGYIIQAGTPTPSNPDGGPGYSLPPEFSSSPHVRGTFGMARRPDVVNPSRSSHGSQFHILLRDAPQMDGSFTVLGQVIKGMDVADKLEKGDKIKDFVVYIRP
ncbi:MAG: peptidylprolyl isomerase [Bdellovibrionales bacterium]|nr:peptidylprolyl isomerase [Bdellovibrionales bacterium]